MLRDQAQMVSAEVDEIYRELLRIYEENYRNPRAALESHIRELTKSGKSRDQAILQLHEKELKQMGVQSPLERRVQELEKELQERKSSENIKDEIYSDGGWRSSFEEELSLGEGIVIFLFSPISAIIGWLMWHEDQPTKADQALVIGIIVFILYVIALWIFF